MQQRAGVRHHVAALGEHAAPGLGATPAGNSQLDPGSVLRDGTLRTFPLHVMYTVGDTPRGLELGAGVTLAWDSSETVLRQPVSPHVGAAASFSIGFRYQPDTGGFLYRACFAPLVGHTDRLQVAPVGGLRLGYAS